MLIINNPEDANLDILKSNGIVIFSYRFLSIYGLPFCVLFEKKLLKINLLLQIALEINNEQANATLAVINNFPNIIISSKIRYEVNIIKQNCGSCTNIFINADDFTKAFNG